MLLKELLPLLYEDQVATIRIFGLYSTYIHETTVLEVSKHYSNDKEMLYNVRRISAAKDYTIDILIEK